MLDNDSTDGSTRGSGFVRIPVERTTAWTNLDWCETIESLQHELLDR